MMQELLFTVGVTCISRLLIVRDRLLERVRRRVAEECSTTVAVRYRIASGDRELDSVLVTPAGRPATALVLLCHGIGEMAEHWRGVQRLLGEHRVASLVFDYSGYGRSSGTINATRCEEDAVAAFHFLKLQMPTVPLSVLGFSLGSGIAAAVIDRVAADHLILCAAFTSFREAARSLGLPRCLAFLVPPIWTTEQALRSCSVPVLIVHCEKDRLFPSRMAKELAAACKAPCQLILVTKRAHNAPIYQPEISYWLAIITRLHEEEASPLSAATGLPA